MSSLKVKLKRLVNNRKGVSQRRLGGKFGKYQTIIQIKIVRSNYAPEKTPKYNEDTKKRSHTLVNLLYKSRTEVIMDDEDEILLF